MKLEERRQLRLKRQLYYVALGSFVLVLIWIGFEIFWAYQRNDEIIVDQPNLAPIEAELYTDIARSYEDRRVFTEDEISRYLEALRESSFVPIPEINSETSTSSATIPDSLPSLAEETTVSSQSIINEDLQN